MKKNIIVIVSVYLFFMFLIYSGVFINNSNPLVVARCYLENLKNIEGFLNYQICPHQNFEMWRIKETSQEWKLYLINSINFVSLEEKGSFAYVQAKLTYKNGRIIYCRIELERNGNSWIVKEAKFI